MWNFLNGGSKEAICPQNNSKFVGMFEHGFLYLSGRSQTTLIEFCSLDNPQLTFYNKIY